MERWQKWAAHQGSALPDDLPLALATEGAHGPVIHATNRAARLSGMRVGERVVDMRALCPDLQVEQADLDGDRRALERLMLWTRRWCPWTVMDGADGLILDTTGSAHLFGGEAALLREMEERLAGLGLSSQIAMAPTWGAAWALARFGPVRALCPGGQEAEMLAPLPARALRLEEKTGLLLHRLGLKTIGDLAAIPRLSLTRRFARAELDGNPLMRLDQAMGRASEPVSSPDAPPVFRTLARLAEPIQDPTPYLPELCEALCAQLAGEGMGCRKLRLTVYHTDGEFSTIMATMSRPSREARHLERLFEGKLERINPGFGFDLITLEAGGVEELVIAQHRLEGGAEDDLDLARLIDRLVARFGASAVTRPTPRASHVPERAQNWQSAMAAPTAPVSPPARERPLRLFEHPEEIRVLYAVPEGPPAQFIWRRQTLHVTRYAGPERIAPEWWNDRPGTRLRDYFKVEDQTGRRFWLYREGLHGDGRGGAPRWFLHGAFA